MFGYKTIYYKLLVAITIKNKIKNLIKQINK